MSRNVRCNKTNSRKGINARAAVLKSSVLRFGDAMKETYAALGTSKKQAVLALAVSLWMAGGGVASALRGGASLYLDVDNNDAITYTAEPVTAPKKEVIDGKTTLMVTGGDWTGWTVYGGHASNSSVDHYALSIDGVDISILGNGVFGGFASAGDALNNTVMLTNSSIKDDVYGGRGVVNANGNIVILDSSAVEGGVYGGYADSGWYANHNTVWLKNSRVMRGTVFGGLYWDYVPDSDVVTGNKLLLSGANTIDGAVYTMETVELLDAVWDPTKPMLTVTGNDGNGLFYNLDYGAGKNIVTSIDASQLRFANVEAISAGDTMDLIKSDYFMTAALASNATTQTYELTPVTGVTVNAALTGSLAFGDFDATHENKPRKLTYTATENKATKLTFGDVEWKDSGALLDHATTLTNVSFNGADVDTTDINFVNLNSRLEINKKMTLVSSFGDAVGTIKGIKYRVGSTLAGMGKASLEGNDLIFTTESIVAQEQTHNTVMGAEAAMAALSAGNDFIGNATEGLSLASNIGADGVSSFAQMGGGAMRQETGSHVDTHTWNAIIALGHQNKKERGTMEYGAFFEYGTGNYSTFNGDERGDGSMHYAGGGLLAKYTMKNNVYVEGSLRAGSVHDDARNVLRNFRGMPYSYETSAPYMGFHLGVGKEIAFDELHSVDVYGKYFFNRRKGVSFNAGGHYDLDAVTSSVLRVGARYVVKRNKWNFYGGLAYEHELDGEAAGKADGVAIRGADVGGGSFRGEIGATMTPGDKSPWALDLNLTGFAGKKRGLTGGVSVAFMF
ncbi:MAG: hypothetical protein J6Z82_04510 [Schwartzia sp.]|nr:hypothetical protein [Schwartzia sp. (in: firmicutes)]